MQHGNVTLFQTFISINVISIIAMTEDDDEQRSSCKTMSGSAFLEAGQI